MPIEPITENTRRELVRKAFDQVALGNVPIVGGALASFGRVFVPSELDREKARWQTDATKMLNEFEQTIDRLAGRVLISDFAFQIGLYISSESEDGIADPYAVENIVDRFTEATEEEIVEACGELSNMGIAHFNQLINSLGYLSLEVSFFEVFDPFVHTWHPTVDGAHLALYVAEECAAQGSAIAAQDMADRFKWGHRRLNPALQLVASYIDDGRKFTGYAPPWAHRYVWADPTERAALREMARLVLGEKL